MNEVVKLAAQIGNDTFAFESDEAALATVSTIFQNWVNKVSMNTNSASSITNDEEAAATKQLQDEAQRLKSIGNSTATLGS